MAIGKRSLASRGPWLMLAVLIGFYIINAFDRSVLSLMVPYLKRDFGMSESQIGLMLGLAFALFYGVFGLPFGVLVDRISRRFILAAGVAFWSLATIACGFAGSFYGLLVARMVLGIAEASFTPAAHALLADSFPRARLNTVMSIFYLGGILGNSISAAVGGVSVAHFAQFPLIELAGFNVRGWQMPFVIVGIIGLLSAGAAYLFREPARTVTHDAPSVPLWPLVMQRRHVLSATFFTVILYSMILYGAVLWTPAVMSRSFGWSPAKVGLLYSVIQLAGAGVGLLIGGAVVDRYLRRGITDAPLRVFMACTIVAAPCGIIGYTTSNPAVFLILTWAFFMVGFCYAGFGAAMIQSVTPAGARGRMASMYVLSIIVVGNGLGPWILGMIGQYVFGGDSIGKAMALLVAIISPVAVLAAMLGMAPLRRAVADITALERSPIPLREGDEPAAVH